MRDQIIAEIFHSVRLLGYFIKNRSQDPQHTFRKKVKCKRKIILQNVETY